ncbi:MAG TPA: hypothetical protein VEB22_11140, partial [Phycisphaerales bacterium]|nr:hypothetical protein [Phycisphaerales bacterium]
MRTTVNKTVLIALAAGLALPLTVQQLLTVTAAAPRPAAGGQPPEQPLPPPAPPVDPVPAPQPSPPEPTPAQPDPAPTQPAPTP